MATASHMAPKVTRVMTRIEFMLARRDDVPPPANDIIWFYLAIFTLVIAMVGVVVLAAGVLN